jgi:competence protein ComEC
LQAVRPRIALISVGKGNDYGHPAPSTLATLKARTGLDVYRTDLDGAVAVESDGRRIEVHPER